MISGHLVRLARRGTVRCPAAQRRLRVLAALAVLLLVGACDRTGPGRAALEAGDTGGARRLFEEAAADAGDGASPALLYDLALATYATGDLEGAAVAVQQAGERAASREDDAAAAAAAFLEGHIAFARAEALQARLPAEGAELLLRERVLGWTEDALAAWARAARLGAGEAASRNVERALLRIDALRDRASMGARVRPRPLPAPPLPGGDGRPPDVPEAGAGDLVDAPPDGVAAGELPPEAVARLVHLLDVKEREKQALREARRRAQGAQVERDW